MSESEQRRRDDLIDPDYEEHVRREVIPKLRSSRYFVSLVPKGEIDVKFAVELGAAIMLDKPIIAVVAPGAKVSKNLVKVADHLIECDFRTEKGRAQLTERLREVIGRP